MNARGSLVFLVLVQCLALVAGPARPQGIDTLAHGDNVELHGTASISDSSRILRLPGASFARWTPQQRINSDAGTLLMWAMPLDQDKTRSHVLASFRWSGADGGYFALSDGWREPDGAHKLHAVLNDRESMACNMPFEFNYTLFLPGRWTQVAVSWRSGPSGRVALYVDGRRICEHLGSLSTGRVLSGPVFLGSDLAAGAEHDARRAEFALQDVTFVPHALNDTEVRELFRRRSGDEDPKWIEALTTPESPADAHERRIMQDEDTRWADSKGEIERRVARVKAAGFNVYMPNVWDGGRAYYPARGVALGASVHDPVDPGYDPLGYLIKVAHREGIAVHPWFIVVRHPSGTEYPGTFLDGAPKDAFNVQSAPFRDFVVSLIVEAARRYDIDGINLDYIQSLGVCSDAQCVEAYRRQYHRELARDWERQLHGEKVPSLMAWNSAPVTDIVRRVSSGVRQSRPQAIISIDANPLDHGSRHEGMDEGRWLEANLIDCVVDMTYDDPLDVNGIDQAVRAYGASRLIINVRNYDLFDAAWADRSPKVMADYIRLIRTRWPGAGVGFYQYGYLDAEQATGLARGVFAHRAELDWHGATL